MRTGFLDPGAFAGPNADESVVRAQTAGATVTRVLLFWNAVETATPADPEDPNDPAYDWASVDRQVAHAVRGGLTPILNITHSPKWARGQAVGLPGTWPSPTKYAQFAKAAARRYSGTFTPSGQTEPLPRVRYWQAWNEPNAGATSRPSGSAGMRHHPPITGRWSTLSRARSRLWHRATRSSPGLWGHSGTTRRTSRSSPRWSS